MMSMIMCLMMKYINIRHLKTSYKFFKHKIPCGSKILILLF